MTQDQPERRADTVLRRSAEDRYAPELAQLALADQGDRPPGWRMSPRAVRQFICGGGPSTRKFYGDDALIERSIVTLAGNRGLLLVGEPGTAKSMLSELLAAAISGTSTNVIQGTAATTDEQIRYSWNYALLLAEGPSERALVPSPMHRGMRLGQLVRFEEVTRCPPEVQDTLVSVMSEKMLAIPELEADAGILRARPGFNLVATANLRDRGVHEMSAALKRRFNFETVLPIADLKQEVELVRREARQELHESGVDMDLGEDVVTVLVETFQDLRRGATSDGMAVERPTTVMSTAEAVSVCLSAGLSDWYFGERKLRIESVATHIGGAVFKDKTEDMEKLRHYFQSVARTRAGQGPLGSVWKRFYAARGNLPRT